MAETSTKPYLVRALYEWCCDNGYTPYLAVSVDADTRVPMQYVRNGEIVLNVSPAATHQLNISNERVEFQARFSGVAQGLSIPIGNVTAIYARETGHGMAFEVSRPQPVVDEGDELAQRRQQGQQAGDGRRRDGAERGDGARTDGNRGRGPRSVGEAESAGGSESGGAEVIAFGPDAARRRRRSEEDERGSESAEGSRRGRDRQGGESRPQQGRPSSGGGSEGATVQPLTRPTVVGSAGDAARPTPRSGPGSPADAERAGRQSGEAGEPQPDGAPTDAGSEPTGAEPTGAEPTGAELTGAELTGARPTPTDAAAQAGAEGGADAGAEDGTDPGIGASAGTVSDGAAADARDGASSVSAAGEAIAGDDAAVEGIPGRGEAGKGETGQGRNRSGRSPRPARDERRDRRPDGRGQSRQQGRAPAGDSPLADGVDAGAGTGAGTGAVEAADRPVVEVPRPRPTVAPRAASGQPVAADPPKGPRQSSLEGFESEEGRPDVGPANRGGGERRERGPLPATTRSREDRADEGRHPSDGPEPPDDGGNGGGRRPRLTRVK